MTRTRRARSRPTSGRPNGYLPIPTHRTVAGLASVAVVSTLGVIAASPLAVTAPWLCLAAGAHWRARSRADADRRRLAADLPPFVDGLTQRLKSGGSLSQALRSCVGSEPVEAELLPFRAGLAAGLGVEASLERVRAGSAGAGERPPGIDLLVITISVLVRRGGAALPSLERLNDTLRSAEWIAQEVRTQSGHAVASALLMAALPAVFVAGLASIDRRLARFYAFDIGGAACLIGAGALSYAGWWWMTRIVRDGQ